MAEIDFDTYASTSRVRPYSRSELRRLWLRFADEPDADQRLADFAGCSLDLARAMITTFSSSAAAQRAAVADKERLRAKDSPESIDSESDTEDADVVDDMTVPADTFPQDALTAALLNLEHGYSMEICAEGHSISKRKTVLVEKTHDENGRNCYRVKHVAYSFHRSRSAALAAAQKHARAGKINLLVFGEK